MKTKKINTKLQVKKMTISSLHPNQLDDLKGGCSIHCSEVPTGCNTMYFPCNDTRYVCSNPCIPA